MFTIHNELQRTLYIAFVIMMSTLIGLMYVEHYEAAASFWPAAGFYVAFYYLYRRKAIPGIVLGLYITQLVSRIFQTQEAFHISFILPAIFITGNLVEVFIITYLMEKLKTNVEKLDNIINGAKFVLATFIGVLIGSLVSVSGIAIFFGVQDISVIYVRWVIGNFTGILIFGSLVFYSHYRDPSIKNSLDYIRNSIIYVVCLTVALYFVFGSSGNNFITFGRFQIFFFILYVVAAFMFSYRMIMFSNLLFLFMMYILHIVYVPEQDLLYEIILLTLYIMTLSSIASIVRSVLIERKKNYDELQQAREYLEKIIVSTNNLFNVENKLPEETEVFARRYLKDMFNLACDIYPKYERASCYIKGETVEYVDARGYDIDLLNSLKFDPSTFFWNFYTPEIVGETKNDKSFPKDENLQIYRDNYGVLRMSIRFTVLIGEERFGGMSFDIVSEDHEPFDEFDIENFTSFQTLVNSYYSIGILNTQNNNLKDDIVLSLVRTLELYDLYTGGHSEEVADMSAELARLLGLSDEEVREVYWAGIVHDIGKIGLPLDILNKNGPLTEEEYAKVKEHSINGFNILNRSKDLKKIANIVKHHHEWWNGEGYPSGLRGVDIPYASQILHVCDAVSAMATDRIYRPALTFNQIIKELEMGLGKQFSPKVTKFMIKFIQDGRLLEFFNDSNKIKV